MPSLRTLAFQAWFRVSRPMTLGVRAAVENADGHVFMVRHTYIGGWFMPGGGVEHGEPVIEALRRELHEEAGVRLTAEPPVVGVYSNHNNFRNDHVVFYRVPWGSWAQEAATSVGEIAETAWVDPQAPIDGVTRGTLQRLAELYRGAPPSPYWAART
ncbi:MAG: NUDIX domain-containing protein [Hyphomonas sp.]|uniref:NUDIX domain-containing protein n=1 Tax=Hyphomonas sp. TaxID=87 RepID=UPI0017A53E74|nr:NUDIX domain-containing protein [Hyphomonas sp.]MBA3068367.1 NUDIX domain-containing protein [Hyphomonas sp.]MBU3920813.1 NUDIX domain-containing protein [Alphaproteobacteria bacterium]MBU4060766.1 NUDIX domain-containing protein [Alphaproteobacteria bacterium]MBU4164750.1 NUDIX domain-containing protein [Alphaproteobacteria bacterium]